MRKFLDNAEWLFTVLAIITYTGGPFVVLLSGGISEGQKSVEPDFALVRQLFQLTYLLSAFLLVLRPKKTLYIITKDKLLLLIIGIIICSWAWSSLPEMTVNRAVALIGTTLFGVYLAARYSLKEQIHLLGWAFGLVIITSILFAVLLPKYGVMGGTHAGAWRGMYTHKNTLGSIMVLSTLTFLVLAIDTKVMRWIYVVGMGGSALLLLLSRSSSPLINLIALLIALPIFRTFRWNYRLRTFTLSLMTVLGYLAAVQITQQAETLTGLVGKDLTFTGRTQLWGYVWEMIWQRPWLGYGYGSLWTGWDSPTAYIWKAAPWLPPTAHNGILEILLNLGLLGLFVVSLHFLINLFNLVLLVSKTKASIFFLPLIFMFYTILGNLTEARFLDRNSIQWVLYVSLIISSQLKSNLVSDLNLSVDPSLKYSPSMVGGETYEECVG